MSFKTVFASLPLLWTCASALPAGPGFWANGTSSPVYSGPEVQIAGAYNLIDTYDSSNWLSKFDVQNIPDPTRTSHPGAVLCFYYFVLLIFL